MVDPNIKSALGESVRGQVTGRFSKEWFGAVCVDKPSQLSLRATSNTATALVRMGFPERSKWA
jgi:hypothetical protein